MKCNNWITNLTLEAETAVNYCYCTADGVGTCHFEGMTVECRVNLKVILYCNCFIPFLHTHFVIMRIAWRTLNKRNIKQIHIKLWKIVIYIYISIFHTSAILFGSRQEDNPWIKMFYVTHSITFTLIIGADLRHSLAELCRNRAGEVGLSFMYRHGAIWRNYRQLIWYCTISAHWVCVYMRLFGTNGTFC